MSRRRSSAASCQLATAGKICLFCGLSEDNEIEYGKLYELGTIVTHYYCLLLSSMMEQRGRDEQGILGFLSADIQKELRRGKRVSCVHCKKIGATLGCCNTKCKRVFHLPCGLRNGSLHQFYGEFRSYCINHRPKQLIDSRVVEEVQNAESTLCYICYDNVNYLDILKTLWAPCCKKNAFFHRKCVQQLANSSGYFFKCPLCNNKKEFQEAMLEHGIFIPLQDASWELVPNAYQELLYRHNQCDAETCVCPKGRSHASSNAKWELVLCRMCGSQGIHRHCGHLKWSNSAWECVECLSILDKSPIVNRPIREAVAAGEAENREPHSGDLESDSELSVGQDSNQQTESHSDNPDSENLPTVKVRPGPLSYKMKEVMKVAQSRQMTKDSSSSLEGANSLTSMTESENGDKKNVVVDDPNTVILLDSDEEPEDIEIISEKLNPKVLTTNDGRKIEIFDMKRHAEQQAKMNKIGNQSAESAARLSSDSAERLSADSANATNSSPQKESKPTITSIQTMKNASPQKFLGDRSLQSRTNAEMKDSTILGRMLSGPNQSISNPKFVSPQGLTHGYINPGTTPQNQREILPKSSLEDNQRIQNPGSTLQHPRILNPQISNLKFIANTRMLSPQSPSSQYRPNLLQLQTNPILNQRPMTPQIFNQRTPQVSNQRCTTPQNIPSPLKQFPTLSPSKQFLTPSPSKQFLTPSPSKQLLTPPPSTQNTTPTKSVHGFLNLEVNPGRALPSNVPQFFQPKILEEPSNGIQISSVCSLDLETFENWETEMKKEEAGDFQFKRKAEMPGPSQYFERLPLDTKKTRISDPGTFQASGNEIKTEMKIQCGEIKYESGGKDLNFKSIYSREFVESKEGERKGRYMLLKRNLVEEALAKANITQSDMMNAGMTAASNQPSTSSVNITSNNYIALPQSNMTFYMGNGESQEVVNIAGKKEGGCHGDAGSSPAPIFPGRLISPVVDSSYKVGVRAEDQSSTKADSQIGSDSFDDSKFSVLCGSVSEGCHEFSETSSSCDSAGLIPDNVSLSDVKFRVCGSDIVQVILYDKYRIDIKMDSTGSRSSRDTDSSPLPRSNFADDFSDSQDPEEEVPPKRIRDFEFEENTLQEFPATSCTSRPINVPDSPSTGVTTRERAAKTHTPAKENLNPVIPTFLKNERVDSLQKCATSPFSNDFRVLRHRKNLAKPNVGTCLNCKVSIDLMKIRDLVETKPHLFSKCDEADYEYKNQEEKLTGVCEIKNKWLLVKSQSEKDFYGVSTRSRLLYKSKSMENLSAAKESGSQKKEETKNRSPIRTGLRRGLKRKCRYSMPCS